MHGITPCVAVQDKVEEGQADLFGLRTRARLENFATQDHSHDADRAAKLQEMQHHIFNIEVRVKMLNQLFQV